MYTPHDVPGKPTHLAMTRGPKNEVTKNKKASAHSEAADPMFPATYSSTYIVERNHKAIPWWTIVEQEHVTYTHRMVCISERQCKERIAVPNARCKHGQLRYKNHDKRDSRAIGKRANARARAGSGMGSIPPRRSSDARSV